MNRSGLVRSETMPSVMKLVSIAMAVAATLLSRIKGITAPRNFTKRQRLGHRFVDVEHVFVECSDQEDARQRAKDKGLGAEPDLHPPHQPRPDFYWHYHPSNHELYYEDGIWRNYHFYFRGRPSDAA